MSASIKRFWRKISAYVIFAAIALAVGGLSSLITGDAFTFEHVRKPAFAPPEWLFPIVWTILYILMGISAGLVWRDSRGNVRAGAISLWGLQLLVNFFWPIFFFVFQYRLLALIWEILLIILVLAMIIRFRKISKTAAYLQIPYLLWLLFAAYLNYCIYLLNK